MTDWFPFKMLHALFMYCSHLMDQNIQLKQVAYNTELSGKQTAIFTEIQVIGLFLDRHPYPK